MPLKIFLDTEYTNFVDPQLISMGLAAESGEEFYAEVPYAHKRCSAFVKESVLPLLGRVPGAACVLADLRVRIITWLQLVRPAGDDVAICVDSPTDWSLFVIALDGRAPSWCRERLIEDSINELLRFEFHKANNYPEHHALYDAMANRYAFREFL